MHILRLPLEKTRGKTRTQKRPSVLVLIFMLTPVPRRQYRSILSYLHKMCPMLLYSDLQDLLIQRAFADIAARLPVEEAELQNCSAQHPVMELLRQVQDIRQGQEDAKQVQEDAKHGVLQPCPGEAPALLDAAALALQAMLRLPPSQQLSQTFALTALQVIGMSSADVHAIRFGLDNSHGTPQASLLENAATLGWVSGLRILIDEGKYPLPVLVNALSMAACHHQKDAVDFLFERISKNPRLKVVVGSVGVALAMRLLFMCDSDGETLANCMVMIESRAICIALQKVTNDQFLELDGSARRASDIAARNTLAWFTADPVACSKLQATIRKHWTTQKARHSSEPTPSTWPLLLSALLSQENPQRHPAFLHALEDSHSQWSLLDLVCHNDYQTNHLINAVSALVQNVIRPAPSKQELISTTPWVILRRRVALTRALLARGAALRTGEAKWVGCEDNKTNEPTELGDWAKQGFTPTSAFLRRHHDWLAPSSVTGQSALFSANSPDTFNSLARLGLDSIIPDNAGHYAAVAGLSHSMDSSRASKMSNGWARLCAAEMTAGRLPLAAACKNANDQVVMLSELAPHFLKLMRTWMKLSGNDLRPGQIASVLESRHFNLIREWTQSGVFDNKPMLQMELWKSLTLQNHRFLTKSQGQELLRLFEEISLRQPSGWSTIRSAWLLLWTGNLYENIQDPRLRPQNTDAGGDKELGDKLQVVMHTAVSRWPVSPSGLSSYETEVLLAIATVTPNALQLALPQGLTPSMKTQLWWQLLEIKKPNAQAIFGGQDHRWMAARALIESGDLLPNLGLDMISNSSAMERINSLRKRAQGLKVNEKASITAALLGPLDEAMLQKSLALSTASASRPRL
jgi:hypothetical protein